MTEVARAHRATDSLHSMIYFAPEADEEYVAIGLRRGRMGYFASRAAPMGAVGAAVVVSTFVNFQPGLVAHMIPRAWTLASTEEILAARLRAADRALRRLLGDAFDGDEVRELAALTREACTALTTQGRPLYAAHAALEWPDVAHLQLWHASTLLREFRGDGHTMALVRAGLTGLEALITHTATGFGFTVDAARAHRGWSPSEWDDALKDLADRGLMTGGELTDSGTAMRAAIEADTDALDLAACRHLGPTRTARLIELGRTLTARIVANGAFAQPGVFARGG